MGKWNEEKHRLRYHMFKTLSRLDLCIMIEFNSSMADLDKKMGLLPLFMTMDPALYRHDS